MSEKTTQTIFPTLRYHDAERALTWLSVAFGFEERMVVRGDDGQIAHAEMTLGGGMVMFGSERDDQWAGHAGQGWVYVVVEDPDALHARATSAGAELAMDLTETDYGSRDVAFRDFEGNLWNFGTYQPERLNEPG